METFSEVWEFVKLLSVTWLYLGIIAGVVDCLTYVRRR